MAETLPLFPLSTVLLPGATLPLHVFEPRYRQLIADLMTGAVSGESFGIIALKPSWRTEIVDVEQLHAIGCSARLRDVRSLEGGRFDIVTKGEQRFELLDIDTTSAPYLCGSVRWLPDAPVGEQVRQALPSMSENAKTAHRRYCEATWRREDWPEITDVEPGMLANRLAADCLLPLQDRQDLLEETCPARRLAMVSSLLRREGGLMRELRAIPVSLAELGPEAGAN